MPIRHGGETELRGLSQLSCGGLYCILMQTWPENGCSRHHPSGRMLSPAHPSRAAVARAQVVVGDVSEEETTGYGDSEERPKTTDNGAVD